MTIKVGESGKTFRVNAGFDLSSNTSLDLIFTKPDGTEVTITDARVSAPAVNVTDDDLGALTASEYFEFSTLSTDFDVAGVWRVYGKYTNTVTDPGQVYIGNETGFIVTEV